MAELAPKWFQPKGIDDKPLTEHQFKIKPLNSVQMWEMNSHMKIIDSDRIGIGFEGQRLAFKYGVLDWKGPVDEEGNPLACVEANWPAINSLVLNVVAREIITISNLAEAERKN